MKKARGERALLLMQYLNDHIKEFRPDKIYIERPLNARTLVEIGATDEVQVFLAGVVFVAEMVAASRGIPVDSSIGPQDARQHFVGRARFTKADGKNAGKVASYQRALQLGWKPNNLDEADAAALWDCGCARSTPNAWAKAAAESRPVKVR